MRDDILNTTLAQAHARIRDRMFELQLDEMQADLEAWGLILAAKGDVVVTIAPAYGVER